MRKIDPNVSLPYWDYTIDNNITRPRDAVVWSDCFFGNSRGEVTSGPFAGWFGGRHRPIRRHAGRSSWLVSKYDMQRLLSFCYFAVSHFPSLYSVSTLGDGVSVPAFECISELSQQKSGY